MICQNLIYFIVFNFYLICIYLVEYIPLYRLYLSIIGNITQAFSFCWVFIFFSISWNNIEDTDSGGLELRRNINEVESVLRGYVQWQLYIKLSY